MKSKKGLTLVEVVVALAVFMIAAVMAYPIMTLAGQSNIQSKNRLDLQQTGNFIAENLSYIARDYSDKDTFLNSNHMQNYGLCPEKETPCTKGEYFGYFSAVLDTDYSYTTSYQNQSIRLDFNDTNNLVKIIVTNQNIKYETMEWLRYGN